VTLGRLSRQAAQLRDIEIPAQRYRSRHDEPPLERERFPSTSVNRTTTCETEVIVGSDEFAAAVTFMSEEEADFEIRQSLSGAVLRTVDAAADADVAKVLLERSDMRFRLKYMLGDWPSEEPDVDPYETEVDTAVDDSDPTLLTVSPTEMEQLSVKLRDYVGRIRGIASRCREEVEKLQAPLNTLTPDERNIALDWIQELVEQSDDYAALASDILDDLRQKFDSIRFGRLMKTTTGWPRIWLMSAVATDRSEFLAAVRFFSGIDRRHWGKLFTPLVNGIRAKASAPAPPQRSLPSIKSKRNRPARGPKLGPDSARRSAPPRARGWRTKMVNAPAPATTR
jgi:hypothetical protein